MFWSEFLLFLHVWVAVIWIGGGLMMQFFGIRAVMSGDPARVAVLGQDIAWISKRVFIPASLLAVASGVLSSSTRTSTTSTTTGSSSRSSSTRRRSSPGSCSSARSPAVWGS
jgi:uncharacterized membrane protein